ncbi:ribosomal protein S18 acetylase RimI-like enzyme [Methanolinea mesophila]|uniref:GNAT family N-acetyltransferase n=1 Tax=Methanolinea mesophila TaxID=547055 RepID=UPI001AE32CBF|nr:GNAT family N-acetyltransferase [Methanolinea mesophila]MBP1928509.1 ribosomal protein S18 acetylase RimI-like enzyme [Methanolinea mesophila]
MGEGVYELELRDVDSWDPVEIEYLYRAAGWWKEEYDSRELPGLIRSSFVFIVALDKKTGKAIGMGRAISDGISDAYLQDLVVLPGFRSLGIGTRIVKMLVESCIARGITWIALIAEPGTEHFYLPNGFSPMTGYVPMRYTGMD